MRVIFYRACLFLFFILFFFLPNLNTPGRSAVAQVSQKQNPHTIRTKAGSRIKVPDEQPTIQKGILAASHGDTVLVAPGTYYENINFRGRNIVVASHYILNKDPEFIETTIINGSRPLHPDTASCVLIISGEDTSAVLQGFTLTGGQGTGWLDEHGAGLYTEGGGVLVAFSSPTICNNRIIDNHAIHFTSSTSSSTGGGGLRIGDCAARVIDNVIMNNTAMYGAGIVLNYTTARIEGNIIAHNTVYQAIAAAPTYGGGGVWINSSGPNILRNNTITDNSSSGANTTWAGAGGAILIMASKSAAQNNIIWNNRQTVAGQIYGSNANSTWSYNDIQGGMAGSGNIDADPQFINSEYYLSHTSPCIDAGDPASPNDSDGTRADIGAQFFDHLHPYLQLLNFFLDDSSDNNNGRADAGETAKLVLTLKNYSVAAKDVRVKLVFNDPAVEALSAETEFGTIDALAQVNNAARPFSFKVKPAVTAHRDTLAVVISSANGSPRTVKFEMIIGTSAILLIDDDADSSYETYYTTFLDQANEIPLTWETSSRGCPSIDSFPYQAEYVIWFTGDDRTTTLDPDEQKVIRSYLNQGGKLLLAGQNIGYDLMQSGSAQDSIFFAQVLHAQFVADNSGGSWLMSVKGNPITEGMRLFFSGNAPAAGNQNSADAIKAISPAELMLTYMPGGKGGALYCADRQTGSKLVYLAFGLEGVAGPEATIGTEFLQHVFTWFAIPAAIDGSSGTESVMKGFRLLQNYPNPFNPVTTIEYELPHNGRVSLTIFDLLGQEVESFVFSMQQSGPHQFVFDAKNLSNGIYFCRLLFDNFQATNKLILLR